MFQGTFRALRHRNYRLFFCGQGMSLIGTWMTRVATGWLVFRLTAATNPEQAPFLLGVVGFAGQIPILLLAPYAGVIVDRWSRRGILVVTQVLSMLQSLALAVLSLTDLITIPQVIALAAFQGFINAFDMPGRQAFVVEMVEDREDLPNAIALNSSMFNGARLIGPAVAGLLIAAVGEGLCFLLDAISYLAVIAALLAMRVKPTAPKPRAAAFQEFKDGVRYAFGFHPIRSLLLMAGVIGGMSVPYQVLMPIVANRLSGGLHGARTLGFLMAAAGIGALIGALYLANRRRVIGLGRVIVLSSITLGAGQLGFALSHTLWLSLALMVVTGFGFIVTLASCNTLVQTIVEDDKRGRTMSLYAMSVLGMAPMSSLLAGWLAGLIGEGRTIMASGSVCVAAGLLFALNLPELRRLIRPIYQAKGILPELAAGLQSATDPSRPQGK